MFKKITFLILVISFTFSFSQQKRNLTHDDYDLWKRIVNPQVSDNGLVMVTSVATATTRGDGYVKIHNAKTGKRNKFHNGYNAKISNNAKYVFFLQKPDYQSVRKEKKQKVKKDKQAKDKLFIFDVTSNSIVDSILRVKSFEVPKDYNEWLIIEKFKGVKPKKDTTQKSVDSLKQVAKKTKKDSIKRKNQLWRPIMHWYTI